MCIDLVIPLALDTKQAQFPSQVAHSFFWGEALECSWKEFNHRHRAITTEILKIPMLFLLLTGAGPCHALRHQWRLPWPLVGCSALVPRPSHQWISFLPRLHPRAKRPCFSWTKFLLTEAPKESLHMGEEHYARTSTNGCLFQRQGSTC